jgi:hypothetical protein
MHQIVMRSTACKQETVLTAAGGASILAYPVTSTDFCDEF